MRDIDRSVPSPGHYADLRGWADALFEFLGTPQELHLQAPTCVSADLEGGAPPEAGLITFCKTDSIMLWSDETKWNSFSAGGGGGSGSGGVFDGGLRFTGVGLLDGGARV